MLAVSSVGLAAAGHVLGAGHADPAFIGLLLAATTAAGYHWSGRERSLPAILAAVVAVQLVAHILLSVGHEHVAGTPMLAGHAGAAVVLALFLRCGEARLHAAARRRYLQWLVTVRLALAGLPSLRPIPRRVVAQVPVLSSLWILRCPAGRGPPCAA